MYKPEGMGVPPPASMHEAEDCGARQIIGMSHLYWRGACREERREVGRDTGAEAHCHVRAATTSVIHLLANVSSNDPAPRGRVAWWPPKATGVCRRQPHLGWVQRGGP